ncbi:MAG: type II/IV secretion system ATPase subunit, partial [Nitrososphaeria archaeon]
MKWFRRSKSKNEAQPAEIRPSIENVQLIEVKNIEGLQGIYVGIGKDVNGEIKYYVIEPALLPEDIAMLEEAKKLIFEKFPFTTGPKLETYNKMVKFLDSEFQKRKKNFNSEKLGYYIMRDMLGYGKIEPMLHDVDVEDISCNGAGLPVYVWHRFYESIPSNVTFSTKDELDAFALRLAYICGKSVSYSNPMLDASLPEGHRLQLTFGSDVAGRGTNFTIRKFKYDPITVVDLINFGTISPKLAAYFWYAIERNLSVLIAGGTASGKTTTLNAISVFIPENSKVITIEDTRELNLRRDNWIASVTREAMPGQAAQDIGLFDLLKSSLRQRPDVIIVGEVRGEEAYTLLQAVATGHGGISTIHAESVEAVIQRLSTRPMNVP